jgi:hypothetical protein
VGPGWLLLFAALHVLYSFVFSLVGFSAFASLSRTEFQGWFIMEPTIPREH